MSLQLCTLGHSAHPLAKFLSLLDQYDIQTLVDVRSVPASRFHPQYNRASQDLGFGAVAASDPDRAGAADVSFVAGQAKMILDGVGLMGRDGHTPRETADLPTLPSQAKRAAVLLYRLAHQESGR